MKGVPENADVREAKPQKEEIAKSAEPVTAKPAAPAATPAVTAAPLSPLSKLARMLPGGAALHLAVLSPADLKLEVTGVADANRWVKQLQSEERFANISLTGKYSSSAGRIISLRLPNTGWVAGKTTKDIDNFILIANTLGMKCKGRTADGSYDQALQLVDAIWKAPGGFSKLYFAPENGIWKVTIQ